MSIELDNAKLESQKYANKILEDLESVVENEKRIITGDSLKYLEDLKNSNNWNSFKSNIESKNLEYKKIFVHLVSIARYHKLVESINKPEKAKKSKWEVITGVKLKK
jgi:hypothetical protein